MTAYRLRHFHGLLLAQAIALAASSLPSPEARGEVGPDRPPAGTRSLFDYIFVKEGPGGTAVYDIPASFQGVLDRLRQVQRGEPLAVSIPMGRSVQRLDTSLKDPRNVAAFSTHARVLYQGRMLPALKDRLFIGYGKKSDQLEVISYNQEAGRFEFQLVKNLSKPGQQQVLYAPREFCSSCHTQQVPFFPRDPWEETTAFPATSKAVAKAMGIGPTVDLAAQKYEGVPLGFADNSVAYALDTSIDLGASLVGYHALWQRGCQVAQGPLDPVGCRATLLKLAFRYLLTFSVSPQSPEYLQLAPVFLSQVQASFGPLVKFPVSDLKTRNPLTANGGYNPLSGNGQAPTSLDSNINTINALKNLTSIPKAFDPLIANPSTDDPYMYHPLIVNASPGGGGAAASPSGYQYPEYRAKNDLPRIRKSDDPKLLNDTINWLSTIIALDRDYYKTLKTAQDGFSKIDNAIDRMAAAARAPNSPGASPNGSTFRNMLAGSPVTADEVLAAVKLFANNGEIIKFTVDSRRPLPAIRTELESTSPVNPGGDLSAQDQKALAGFKTYCSTCHGRGAAIELFPGDFSGMTGERPTKLLRRLDWERCKPGANSPMPPQSSANRGKICQDPASRAAMIEAIRRRYFASQPQPCGAEYTLAQPLSAAQVKETFCRSAAGAQP